MKKQKNVRKISKKMKKQRGITLVALVVTIIIMLILAGISVSLVAGSSGLMSRATSAVAINESATAAEQAELKIMEIQVDYYNEYYVQKTIKDKMREYVETNGGAVYCSNSRYYMTISGGTVTVSVGKSGVVVATRNYNTTSSDFKWVDDKWTYLK